MDVKFIAILWLALLAALSNVHGITLAGDSPNVVLIMTDDQGYGDIGAHGNIEIRTPNLDALHAQSVRFTNFHVSPTCSPTRSSLLTGRYNMRVGVWHTVRGRCLPRANETFLPQLFAAGGYHTGIFGKWHLGESYPFRPQDRGFQESVWHGCGAPGQTSDIWGNDYYDDTYWRNGNREKFTGYCTNIWFDEALQFIERHRGERFFCYIPTNAPHEPFRVDAEYRQPYIDAGIEEPRATFYGMISNIDENIGRLSAQLENWGLSDNTILIFMTDNGSVAGMSKEGRGFNAGMRGMKGSPYDGGHRVPFFIRWPDGNLAHGSDFDQLTAHIDVAPTLIDLCGLTHQQSPQRPFDGQSLVSILQGSPPAQWNRVVFATTQRVDMPIKWRLSVAMNQRWRLLDGELYDMQADPGQQINVLESNPQQAARLSAAYDRWWKSISEGFDDPARLVIGSDEANPTQINCHDLRSPTPTQFPWKQHMMSEGLAATGFWSVQIAKPGTYRFSLRRWEKSLETPIQGAVAGGKALPISSAGIRIGDSEASVAVTPEMQAAVMELELPVGPATMQTWFATEAGTWGNAYYVEVQRIP